MCKKMSGFLFTVLFSFGLVTNVCAFSDGYILAAHHMGSATYLFDKNMEIVHKWTHDSLPNPQSGYACYLLPNGNLLRSSVTKDEVAANAAPKQGTISEIDANDNIVWTYTLADSINMLHHDFKVMPNGNILMVTFVHYEKEEAIEVGIDSSLFSTSMYGGFGKTQFGGMGSNTIELESIMELQPDRTGAGNHQIVWRWNIADHLIPAAQKLQHPEKFSGDLGPMFFGQFVHLNGLDYNPTKDLIVFTSRIFSEFFIIDHSTTTAEAAGSTGGTYGKGGDLLFRWGRPSHYCPTQMEVTQSEQMVYNRDTREFDTVTVYDTTYFHENDVVYCLHSPTWIPEGYSGAGDVMFFHNNVDASMSQRGSSQVIEVKPETDANGAFIMTPGTPTNPLTPTWIYEPSVTMFSQSMSTAIRMPSGNTIVHEAYPGGNNSGTNGTVREVDPSGAEVWGPVEFELPESEIPETDTSDQYGMGGMGMTNPNAFNPAKIMYYPGDYVGVSELKKNIGLSQKGSKAYFSPNTVVPAMRKHVHTLSFSNVSGAVISLYTLQGRHIRTLQPRSNTAEMDFRALGTGSYIVKVHLDGRAVLNEVVSLVR